MAKIEFNLAPWQAAAVFNDYVHFCMYGGVGAGKSYSGSHFAIKHFLEYPELTGFIGANDYNQLSQATLRELFYWMEYYQIPYCVDRIPPQSWGARKALKTYRNTISVKVENQVCTTFVRVLSNPDSIRGIELSWYWLDELRDTKKYAHEMILGRMRESKYMKGLATTTTNGQSWDYQLFAQARRGQKMYGSLHVKTIEAVKAGILPQNYYDSMLASYSELMAAQELNAEHVNIHGGRAYYASGPENRCEVAPWGDHYPTRQRPLIVGCDFNFQPAPCVWMVGQLGPYDTEWENKIHWFKELAAVEASTPSMTMALLSQFPEFFYKVYGDASGNRGTTSNAGETDYNQMAQTLEDGGALFTIDVDQANPLVKNRVENMNALFRNSAGEIRQTYSPSGCPLFDGDVGIVGWKQNVLNGRGKLDSGGDIKRTHASDGAGYAVFKIFPPGRRGKIIDSLPSDTRSEISNVL